jgi:hypothetical protein
MFMGSPRFLLLQAIFECLPPRHDVLPRNVSADRALVQQSKRLPVLSIHAIGGTETWHQMWAERPMFIREG